MHGRARLKPWEIERLTMTEICLALDDDLERRSGQSMSPYDMLAYAQRWRTQSVADRLARAREED